MKAKITFLLMVSLLTIANFHFALAQSAHSDEQALSVLKVFYTSYITDVDKGDLSKLDALKKKFCTATLLHKIPKLSQQMDADPFLKAQDSNIKFLKSLIVEKDLKKDGNYIVSYGIDEKVIIHLRVVKQNGNYKIDNVW